MRTGKLSIGATLFCCLFLSCSSGALQSLRLYFDKTNFTHYAPFDHTPSIGSEAVPRSG